MLQNHQFPLRESGGFNSKLHVATEPSPKPGFDAFTNRVFRDFPGSSNLSKNLEKIKKSITNSFKSLVFDQSRGCTQNWTPRFWAWSPTECYFWLSLASKDSHLEEGILQNNNFFFRYNIFQRAKPMHNLSNKKFWMCAPAASAREKAATRSLQKREGRPRKPTGFRGFRGRPSARARARARAKCWGGAFFSFPSENETKQNSMLLRYDILSIYHIR